jgi:hypothetical protein
LIAFLQQEHPGALPRQRTMVELTPDSIVIADDGMRRVPDAERARQARAGGTNDSGERLGDGH